MKNSTTQSTSDNTSQKIGSALESGRKFLDETAGEYGTKIKEGYDMAVEKAKIAGTEVNDFVQKRPLLALGVALGAGVIVGRLFARSGKAHVTL